ncbi:hypothetical protein A0257_21965 [Hymenobacter psoromatis]|nr:hypothetical protein A0257_21965 [Hymenobacter psoromatis]
MTYSLLLAGVGLAGLAILDLIKTTLSSQGGAWGTRILARTVWRVFFVAAGRRGQARLLDHAGLTILLSVLLSWIAGMWGGLFLVLLADAGSVVSSSTHAPAGAIEKLYYAGSTLSTLGSGDYVPTSDTWRLVTNVASFAGLVFITTSITYFVPVLSAISLQRQLSLYINGLGETPLQIVANGWDGTGFTALLDSVPPLCQLILQHAMNHRAYPVIHYFHSRQPRQAVVLALARLSEAHLLLAHAIAPAHRPPALPLHMLRAALDEYLAVVAAGFPAATTKEPPTLPALTQVAARPLPLRNPTDILQALAGEQPRRGQVGALLYADGWTWPQVYQPPT